MGDVLVLAAASGAASGARQSGFNFDPSSTLPWAVPSLLIVPFVSFLLAISSIRTRRSASAMAMLGTVVSLALTVLVAWGLTKRGSAFQASYQYINMSIAFSGPTNFQSFAIDLTMRADKLTVAALFAVEVCLIGALGWHQVMGRSEPGAARFHALITALLFAATGVLLSQDLAELFAFWAIGGAVTYLLLEHRWGLDEPAKRGGVLLALLFGVLSIDLVVVRENTEGAYVGIGGQFKRGTPDEIAIQEDVNTRKGVERIIHYAFELARRRRAAGHPGRVTMVDKSNALYHAHDLWQRVFALERQGASEIEAEHLFVDAAAMQLVKGPSRFDVIVTSNMFGDILSDLASELVGGLGQAPSANINPDNRRGLFEPVHGSAPKHAGKGIANPVGAILAGAMMLRHLGDEAGASQIENAVMSAAGDRRTTKDLGGVLSTTAAADAVLERLERIGSSRPS